MVDFQDVPQDVFLSITNHLELGDVLTLLSVCSTFRSFAKPRSLWIDTLKRVAKHRALALSTGTQIRDLEVDQLVRVARHTYRVQHSWEQDSPRPVRSKVLEQQAHHGLGFTGSGYGERLLATIPGTPLLVLRSVRPGAEGAMHLVALDIEEVHGPSTLQVPAFESYAHWDGSGSLVIALCGRDTPSLIVVSITYHPEAAPAMSIIYETMTSNFIEAAFIYEDVVGFVHVRHSIHRQEVFLINYVTGASAVLPQAWQPSISTFNQPLFCVIGAAPFFVTYTQNDGWAFNVNRLALDLRSTVNGHHPPCALRDVAFERVAQITWAYRTRQYIKDIATVGAGGFSALSPTGLVILLECHYLHDRCSPHSAHLVIGFWPFDTLTRQRYSGDPPAYANLEGAVRCHGVSASGAYMVVLVYNLANLAYLLHFIQDPPAIEVRQLEIPPAFGPLEGFTSVAVDERYGVIHLAERLGRVAILKYA